MWHDWEGTCMGYSWAWTSSFKHWETTGGLQETEDSDEWSQEDHSGGVREKELKAVK